jgi:hypothetical protein
MKMKYELLALAIAAVAFSTTCTCWTEEAIIVNGKVILSKSMVDEDMNGMCDIVKDGNSRSGGKRESVYATQILSFSKEYERLEKTPEIEKVTGYSREWFRALKKNLESMFHPKMKMETAILNRDQKTYLQAEAEYEKNRKIFLDTVKKPKRASGKNH